MRRQGSLENTIMLEKLEGSRKWGRPNMTWIESIKEVTGVESTGAEQGSWVQDIMDVTHSSSVAKSQS